MLLSILDMREFKDLFLDIVFAGSLGAFFSISMKGWKEAWFNTLARAQNEIF